ncbi:MAG: DUF302 domain-containing protein [Bacteroidales bacterium]|nr:DUF302 domain-containing protein [Bacteroidales bacterium]
MKYYFSKKLDTGFDDALEKTTEAMKSEGFGVLTEINVNETLKKKLDVDFRKYRILGGCIPQMAHQALQAEDKIGTMLPCNFVVQETGDGKIEVAGVDPMASMQAIENKDLEKVAGEVNQRVQNVINKL